MIPKRAPGRVHFCCTVFVSSFFEFFFGSLLVPLGILCSSLAVFWAHLGWGFLDLRSLALFLVQWWHLILVNIISLARS
jgi:hypothetical protein